MNKPFQLLAYSQDDAFVSIEKPNLKLIMRISQPYPDEGGGEECTYIYYEKIVSRNNSSYRFPTKRTEIEYDSWNSLIMFLVKDPITEESVQDAKDFLNNMPPNWLNECVFYVKCKLHTELSRDNAYEANAMLNLLQEVVNKRLNEEGMKSVLNSLKKTILFREQIQKDKAVGITDEATVVVHKKEEFTAIGNSIHTTNDTILD